MINNATQEIIDKIWGYFENNNLTEGKIRPKIKINDNIVHENSNRYLAEKQLGFTHEEIMEKYNKISCHINGHIILSPEHQNYGHIILEELTHYIRSDENNPRKSADFSIEFVEFVASQLNQDFFDYLPIITDEEKREYQTNLFKKWWNKIK